MNRRPLFLAVLTMLIVGCKDRKIEKNIVGLWDCVSFQRVDDNNNLTYEKLDVDTLPDLDEFLEIGPKNYREYYYQISSSIEFNAISVSSYHVENGELIYAYGEYRFYHTVVLVDNTQLIIDRAKQEHLTTGQITDLGSDAERRVYSKIN